MSDFPCDHIRFCPEVASSLGIFSVPVNIGVDRIIVIIVNKMLQKFQDEGMKELIPSIRIPNSTNLDAVPLELNVAKCVTSPGHSPPPSIPRFTFT